MTQTQEFKHGEELRQHWRVLQRQYRAKKKVGEAQIVQARATPTSLTPKLAGVKHEGSKSG